MLIENYPFTVLSRGDISRPYLPVRIINPSNNKEMYVYALIDTGADECALPASFAKILGHDLQAGGEKKINTGNGTTIAYSHLTEISIQDFTTKGVLVDFMPNLNIPLLGVGSFLSKFKLTIDYTKKEFSLE